MQNQDRHSPGLFRTVLYSRFVMFLMALAGIMHWKVNRALIFEEHAILFMTEGHQYEKAGHACAVLRLLSSVA
jgi:hypothetical protein